MASRWLQQAVTSIVSMQGRRAAGRRTEGLPPIGADDHLTSVLRLPAGSAPAVAVEGRHYRYPPETLHVTVANLDKARARTQEAVAALAERELPAVRLQLLGVGCSPDTLFIKCVYDPAFGYLRRQVRDAFGLPSPRQPRQLVYSTIAFANVVRFEGRGEWSACPDPTGEVVIDTLEIAQTDRYLSAQGTTTVAVIRLHGR